ncbi:MAG: HAMP domain-containing histidine kinase, partial [Chloroflexota bacterium]
VNVGPVNLAPVVTQALKRLDIEIREAHAQVILPGEWPLVTGYGPWLEEVFANYVSNAIKYGGEPPLITLGADCQPNGAVRCWVRDNGRGLSAEQQGQLFAEFTRLHGARASGHGLGLAIVRRIIERLGGQVGVVSADGEGSEFYFILPGVPAVANQETKP